MTYSRLTKMQGTRTNLECRVFCDMQEMTTFASLLATIKQTTNIVVDCLAEWSYIVIGFGPFEVSRVWSTSGEWFTLSNESAELDSQVLVCLYAHGCLLLPNDM